MSNIANMFHQESLARAMVAMTGLPLFVVIEGIDGAGKSTVIDRVIREFNQDPDRNVRPLSLVHAIDYTTNIGRAIHNHLQHRITLSPLESALFFANNREACAELIIARLHKGDTHLICDRYHMSNMVYAQAKGVHEPIAREISRSAVRPHITIFLSIDPETAFQRIQQRKRENGIDMTSMESKPLQQAVQRYYERAFGTAVREHPDRYFIVDNNGPIESAVTSIIKIIRDHQAGFHNIESGYAGS